MSLVKYSSSISLRNWGSAEHEEQSLLLVKAVSNLQCLFISIISLLMIYSGSSNNNNNDNSGGVAADVAAVVVVLSVK